MKPELQTAEPNKKLEIEARIHWLEQQITQEYARIGKLLASIVETENHSINKMADEVIQLKNLLQESGA